MYAMVVKPIRSARTTWNTLSVCKVMKAQLSLSFAASEVLFLLRYSAGLGHGYCCHCSTLIVRLWVLDQHAGLSCVSTPPPAFHIDVITSTTQTWHGIECILHISSRRLPWIRDRPIQTRTDGRLRRRTHLCLPRLDGHASMAGEARAIITQDSCHFRHWPLSRPYRAVLYWRSRYHYRLCESSYRPRWMSCSVYG